MSKDPPEVGRGGAYGITLALTSQMRSIVKEHNPKGAVDADPRSELAAGLHERELLDSFMKKLARRVAPTTSDKVTPVLGRLLTARKA